MRRKIALSVIFYLIITFSIVNVVGEETVEPFFTLVLRAGEGENYPDYGLYVAQYLQEINIDLEVKIDSGGFYRFDPYLMDDFDISLAAFLDLETQSIILKKVCSIYFVWIKVFHIRMKVKKCKMKLSL